MGYRIKTMSGWWKGRNRYGVPMSGPDCGDVLEFDTKDDALAEICNIPAIVGFDEIVPVKKRNKEGTSD